MVIHGRTQEVLVTADNSCSRGAGRAVSAGTGVGDCSVYLYSVLKSQIMNLTNRAKAVLSTTLVLIVIFVLVLSAEGLVRVRQYIKYGTITVISDLEFDENSGLHIPKKGMKTASISINSQGFRGPELDVPKPSNLLRIGFIGASTTYCSEVSSNEMTWPALVSRGLESSIPNLKVEYINAGVSGYSTENSLINLEKRVIPLEPDIVVIYHATNDLSGETRKLAQVAGIERVNLAKEESWLGKYSLLWLLVEKNLALLSVQQPSENELLNLDIQAIGSTFRNNLERMVFVAKNGSARLVALTTFAIHLREGMNAEQRDIAMSTARYYMPYLSSEDLLKGFKYFNQIIREVAKDTGALLIENENDIPGDPIHFNDSVHFTDAGSKAQSVRIIETLLRSAQFQAIAAEKRHLATTI